MDRADYKREWYLANREKALERARQWKLAHPDYQRTWRSNNKGMVRQYNRRWAAANIEKRREINRRNAGLPTADRPPPENCECCDSPFNGKTPHLDHDHETGKFRGWICRRCNISLGFFGDNAAGLERALNYLLRLTP